MYMSMIMLSMGLLLLMGLFNLLSTESYYNFLSYYIYECGFDCIYWSHNKISLHFFKLGIIFILFDLEIMYLISLFVNLKMYQISWCVLCFVLMTLLLEMLNNSMLWFY